MVVVFRGPGFLEFGVSLSPPFLTIKHNAVPEKIAPGDVLRLGLGRKPQWFINLVPLLRVHSAEKIDWPGNNVFTGQLERSGPDQNSRAIKTIGDTKPPRQFHRFAGR